MPAAAPEMIDFFNIPLLCRTSPKAPPGFPNYSQWKHTQKCLLTWMLSSTFFHWQKRVNLSLWGGGRGKNVDLVICLQTVLPPSNSSVSPLDELLEDLSPQAVTDLHYVWLHGDRHTNSRSSQIFAQEQCDLRNDVNVSFVHEWDA